MAHQEYPETRLDDEPESPEQMSARLLERCQELLIRLEEGDIGSANQLIKDMNNARDETLYLEVGRLTRGLHNAIRDFHLDIGLQGHSKVHNEISEISDASSRLGYVISLTEEAANTTMDNVESSAPIVKALAERACTLQQDWRAFRHSRAMATEDEQMFARIDELLSSTAADASTVNTSLNEILMAQGYQDLSGQVIKRVIALVKDVECSLVRLVRLASSVEAVAGLPLRREPAVIDDNRLRAEGPQVNNNSGDVISGQDDVDDLLSSLGF